MKTRTYIIVRNQFIACHRWLECPHEEVAFLQHWHRHVFKVRTEFEVTHNNRDLEFFMVQTKVQNILNLRFEGRDLDMSCEMMAEAIIEDLVKEEIPVLACAVSEDGENEAVVQVI